ncbi:MAG: septum formation protein Maf [Legionellales bacterium]|nr:septum formation protein Maf [Legionellales bacterium]|tara:strand:+ start:548 stop:1147 length:600 start_codon:yes stop_codon:yes gene_type:complete
MHPLLLASSSTERYRLLSKLGIPFETVHPNIDETPFSMETPSELVQRLAASKADVIRTRRPECVIISGDQVISVQNKILSKPLTHDEAVDQLRLCSGATVTSYSGLSIYAPETKTTQTELITTTIVYREFDDQTIQAYLDVDKPYECAGSIRLEGMGFVLIEQLTSGDPYAIHGLPLLTVVRILSTLGFTPAELLQIRL